MHEKNRFIKWNKTKELTWNFDIKQELDIETAWGQKKSDFLFIEKAILIESTCSMVSCGRVNIEMLQEEKCSNLIFFAFVFISKQLHNEFSFTRCIKKPSNVENRNHYTVFKIKKKTSVNYCRFKNKLCWCTQTDDLNYE